MVPSQLVWEDLCLLRIIIPDAVHILHQPPVAGGRREHAAHKVVGTVGMGERVQSIIPV